MLLALFSDLQLLFERLLTRLNGGNSISLESFEILSPSSIHPLFLTLPGKYQEYYKVPRFPLYIKFLSKNKEAISELFFLNVY